MQLSTRGRYAVTAMVDLATRQTLGCECGPICLAEIAARQRLSKAYLEQLFGKLRRAGLVGSARGPGGGQGPGGVAIGWHARQRRSPSPTSSLRGTSRFTPSDARMVVPGVSRAL